MRKQVFDTFWKAYGQYENTLGALLAQRVNTGVISAKLRKYPSAAAASLRQQAQTLTAVIERFRLTA